MAVTVFENEKFTIDIFEDDTVKVSYFEDNHFVDEILLEPADFRNGAISNFMERRCKYH